MTLTISNESPAALAASLRATSSPAKPAYMIVYASLVNGRSWCPDCVRAEPLINEKFKDSADTVPIVYLERDAWRTQDNIWKQQPFAIPKLPTLVKATGDRDWEYLVEEDVYDQKKLDAFVGTASKK
ncbi:hypothetical protein PVAG01_08482 [Phlyctema vagabunda]|uniref:Thioredoxin domain-containing protein n=1 Tax=Phlyctema vagabunda TaxID=108571 RepID=A0ABR4P9I9_9HELO